MKLYEVRSTRISRIETLVKVWAETPDTAITTTIEEARSPGGYMFDQGLETLSQTPPIATEITDPVTLAIWQDAKP